MRNRSETYFLSFFSPKLIYVYHSSIFVKWHESTLLQRFYFAFTSVELLVLYNTSSMHTTEKENEQRRLKQMRME